MATALSFSSTVPNPTTSQANSATPITQTATPTAQAAYNLNGGRGAGSMDANGNFTPTNGNTNNATPTGAPSSFTASNPGPMAPATSASTTTISNSNKQNQVTGIQNNTAALSQTGVTKDQNGNAIYANGTTVINPADEAAFKATNPGLSYTAEDQQHANNSTYAYGQGGDPTKSPGGYVGDMYYAPGATLPIGADGKQQQVTPTSPTDDQILSSLNLQKSQADALTASTIDNIQQQYAQLIQQQQQVNTGAAANVNAALTMGGVTGQGSSAQFAPLSSAAIMQSQVSYGIQQMADLQTKENTAILAAQQAGQNQDFALQDKINSQISSIRDTKLAAATKLNDQITTANQKLADAKLASTQSTAVNNLYMSGVTDPSKILDTLNSQGMNLTADQVKTILASVDTNAVSNLKDIQTAGITAPFANKNGQIINAQTGQAFETPEDFFKAAGVSSFEDAYSQGKIQDVQPKLTFQTEKVGGQEVRYGFDAQGNVVSKTVLGGSGSGSGTTKTTSKDDIQSMSSQLDSIKGEDKYISPEDYKTALSAWTKAGYSATSFKTNFGNYINPADPKDYK